MIRVLVNHNRIAGPIPVANIIEVVRRDAPIEVVEPESARTAAFETKNVAGTESARETTVLPWTIQVVVGIIATGIVADPFSIPVNVGRVRVTGLILITLSATILSLPLLLTIALLGRRPLLSRSSPLLLPRGLRWRFVGWWAVRWYKTPMRLRLSFASLAIYRSSSKSRERNGYQQSS